jgi:RNA polymerase sigma-70 factor (ECF subfamily)
VEGDLDLEAFCKKVHPRLVRSLAVYVGDPAVAEELAQDALVRLVARWDQVQAMDAREMWVYRTALNAARSWFRRRGAERRALQRADSPERATWSDPETATVVAVRAAISQLPARQRAALVLRHYADLGVDETAAALGCASGTVKALTHQARQRLAAALGETEGETHV